MKKGHPNKSILHVLVRTWFSIHLKPIAAVHSFLEALLFQSKLYTLSRVSIIEEMLLLLSFLEKISPLELTFMWLLRRVSNQPLPDRCDDIIAKNRTALHLHSSLEFFLKKYYIKQISIKQTRLLNLASGQISPAVSCRLRVMHKLNLRRRNCRLITWLFHNFDLHYSWPAITP